MFIKKNKLKIKSEIFTIVLGCTIAKIICFLLTTKTLDSSNLEVLILSILILITLFIPYIIHYHIILACSLFIAAKK